jgi:hypothetical protein
VLAAAISPTEAELAAHVDANPQVFMVDTSYTFAQVFIDPSPQGPDCSQPFSNLHLHGLSTVYLEPAFRKVSTIWKPDSGPDLSNPGLAFT